MLPLARSEQLTIQELPEETLVFDHVRNKAHCLNRTSLFIWKHCDGRTSPAKMAVLLRRELSLEHPEVVVELALEQLSQRNLLQEAVERQSSDRRRTRRDLLKKMAVAAVAIPAIMTVVAPRAAQAVSLSCKANSDCSFLNGLGGCTVGACVSGKCAPQFAAANSPCTLQNGDPRGFCMSGICTFG